MFFIYKTHKTLNLSMTRMNSIMIYKSESLDDCLQFMKENITLLQPQEKPHKYMIKETGETFKNQAEIARYLNTHESMVNRAIKSGKPLFNNTILQINALFPCKTQ